MSEPNHTPTEEEIREACQKIQEGWSESDFKRRARHIDEPVEIKTVGYAGAPLPRKWSY